MAREEPKGTEKFSVTTSRASPSLPFVVLHVEVESSEFLDLSTKKLVEC